MTWEEIYADPHLAKLPFRIESDKWGNVVLSPPPGADHCEYQGEIIVLLGRLLPDGHPLGECPIQTNEGVKACDSAWLSNGRRKKRPRSSIVYLVAPEICVEVRSPSNSFREIMEKFVLYFDKQAKECWMCDKNGRMSFFNADGPLPQSEICPDFPAKLPMYG